MLFDIVRNSAVGAPMEPIMFPREARDTAISDNEPAICGVADDGVSKFDPSDVNPFANPPKSPIIVDAFSDKRLPNCGYCVDSTPDIPNKLLACVSALVESVWIFVPAC